MSPMVASFLLLMTDSRKTFESKDFPKDPVLTKKYDFGCGMNLSNYSISSGSVVLINALVYSPQTGVDKGYCPHPHGRRSSSDRSPASTYVLGNQDCAESPYVPRAKLAHGPECRTPRHIRLRSAKKKWRSPLCKASCAPVCNMSIIK